MTSSTFLLLDAKKIVRDANINVYHFSTHKNLLVTVIQLKDPIFPYFTIYVSNVCKLSFSNGINCTGSVITNYLFQKEHSASLLKSILNILDKFRQKSLTTLFLWPRSSRPDVFHKKAVLINFAKFTRIHLRRSRFLVKLQAAFLQLYLQKYLWYFL